MADYSAMAQRLMAQTLQQFPVLGQANIAAVQSPQAQGQRNMLEAWPAGETGSPDYPRPQGLPVNQYGVQIFNPKTRPMDVAGDVASHFLVNSDPKMKGYYNRFQNSLNIDQQQMLQEQYAWAKKNEGEKRSFSDWLSASGMPAYFRGFPFQQWSPDFNKKAYTPDQTSMLDSMMKYLRAGK